MSSTSLKIIFVILALFFGTMADISLSNTEVEDYNELIASGECFTDICVGCIDDCLSPADHTGSAPTNK